MIVTHYSTKNGNLQCIFVQGCTHFFIAVSIPSATPSVLSGRNRILIVAKMIRKSSKKLGYSERFSSLHHASILSRSRWPHWAHRIIPSTSTKQLSHTGRPQNGHIWICFAASSAAAFRVRPGRAALFQTVPQMVQVSVKNVFSPSLCSTRWSISNPCIKSSLPGSYSA